MGDSRVPPDLPPVSAVAEPGLARRRKLRAAGINVSIDDFTDEEREVRGFPVRAPRTNENSPDGA